MSNEARRQQILDAAANLSAVHDRWAEDPKMTVPSAELEDAIDDLIAVCASGDIPGECREIIKAVDRMAEEWDAYRAGDMRQDGQPNPTFWSAVANVFRCHTGVVEAVPRTIEPVSLLFEQLKDFPGRDGQIARMYGHRVDLGNGKSKWIGPFFDSREVPRGDLIREEATKPGSVIPAGWIHPAEEARIREANGDLAHRIRRTTVRSETETAASTYEDPASIEELLRERQFPDVIAKVKRTTESVVRELAAELGIEVNERPNLAATRGPYDEKMPEINGHPTKSGAERPNVAEPKATGSVDVAKNAKDSAAKDAGDPKPKRGRGRPKKIVRDGDAERSANDAEHLDASDESVTEVDATGSDAPNESNGPEMPNDTEHLAERLPELVATLSEDPSLGVPDIARKLREDFGIETTPQRVNAILREQREAVATA